MNTLYNADCCLILAKISWSDADPIHATAQALDFFKACREHDPEWQQYASNPDLVGALGTTADVFLGWRIEPIRNTIVAIRPGFGHIEFDGSYYWVIELGFEVQHASSTCVRSYETALRWLRAM